jgi:hypothetical protein
LDLTQIVVIQSPCFLFYDVIPVCNSTHIQLKATSDIRVKIPSSPIPKYEIDAGKYLLEVYIKLSDGSIGTWARGSVTVTN